MSHILPSNERALSDVSAVPLGAVLAPAETPQWSSDIPYGTFMTPDHNGQGRTLWIGLLVPCCEIKKLKTAVLWP